MFSLSEARSFAVRQPNMYEELIPIEYLKWFQGHLGENDAFGIKTDATYDYPLSERPQRHPPLSVMFCL